MLKAFLVISLFFSIVVAQHTLSDAAIVAEYYREIHQSEQVAALILQADELRIVAPEISPFLDNLLTILGQKNKRVMLATTETYSRAGIEVKQFETLGSVTALILDNSAGLIGGFLDGEQAATQWIALTENTTYFAEDFDNIWGRVE